MLAFVGIFSSCEKDEADTVKPVIEIIAPENKEVIQTGSEIHFEVDFSDNIELKSYKKTETTPWHFHKSWNFDAGKKNAHIHHHEIVIPTQIDGKEVATGHYHFMVYCIDAAGNENWTVVEIEIVK